MQGSGDRPHRLKFIRGARSRPRHLAPCGPAKQSFLPCRGQMVVHVGFSIIAVSQRVSGCSSTHGGREIGGGGGGKGAEQHQARRAASGRQGGAIGVRASSYSMGDRGLSSTGSAWCTAFSCHRMRAAEAWRKGRARVHQQRVHTLDESWRRRWRQPMPEMA